MSVSEASGTLTSRKKMRFMVPPANRPVRFWGESEDEYDSTYTTRGDDSEDENQHDQEHSESDGNEEGQDEEDEQAEEENQYDHELSDYLGDEEEMQDVEEEQVEEESQRNQELSESDADEERQDAEEEQMEEQSQSNQEHLESDADEEEMQDVEVEQVEEESQSNQERSESDADEESQGVEEEQVQVEMENQRNHAPLESSGDEEEGQDEEAEQAEDVPEDGGFQKGSSEPALAPPLSKRATIANLTLDEDMLDCGVCCLPLKPPIFQCDVGHVVCSSCRDKLAATRRCHMCCAALAGGYRRCHAMEQLVESIRGSCPNAPYGCAVRIAYYDQHAHLQVCRHARCHCPAEACGFVGSTAALLDHFVVAHKWPCTTGVKASMMRDIDLHDGFNIVSVVHDARQYLFLLIVARTPLGRAISCLCIHPPQVAATDSLQSASKNVKWRLMLSYSHNIWEDADDYFYHHQDCAFKVACTDLSSGMPNSNECFQFIVPSSVQPDAEATVLVMTNFIIQ